MLCKKLAWVEVCIMQLHIIHLRSPTISSESIHVFILKYECKNRNIHIFTYICIYVYTHIKYIMCMRILYSTSTHAFALGYSSTHIGQANTLECGPQLAAGRAAIQTWNNARSNWRHYAWLASCLVGGSFCLVVIVSSYLEDSSAWFPGDFETRLGTPIRTKHCNQVGIARYLLRVEGSFLQQAHCEAEEWINDGQLHYWTIMWLGGKIIDSEIRCKTLNSSKSSTLTDCSALSQSFCWRLIQGDAGTRPEKWSQML